MRKTSSCFYLTFSYLTISCLTLMSGFVYTPLATAEPQTSMTQNNEAVIYFTPEQAQVILGDQSGPEVAQRNESVIYISNQQAQSVLGDDEPNLMTLDAINSMPATAAGHVNQEVETREENVTYINAAEAELLLGPN